MNTKINIEDRLREAGVKPSLQRMAIMKYLVNHAIHPTVDTIYSELAPEIPTLSKTTVYNTLKLLEDTGAIQSITIDEKNVRYDADISNHAHFKCKKCGKIIDLALDFIPPKIEKLQINEYQVYYKGLCEDCQ
jgi:Fur family ferric uptake transcriptional regulator/Fur family peroxide stress response transcriptional regulator